MIAAAVPLAGLGNKVPAIFCEDPKRYRSHAALLLANLDVMIFDFVVRQKVHSTSLNWFIVEQLPVVPPRRYETSRYGPKTAGMIVREAVLELTYTAHDMAPFARDMGYIDKADKVKPPFTWNEERRLILRSKLDAVFFHLYGVTDPRRHPLYLLDLSHRRTQRGSRLWRRVPFPRALPRLDERAGGGQAGCGDQSVKADHCCSCKPCAAADCGLATVRWAHKQGRRFRLPSWGTGRNACTLPIHPSRQASAGL